MISTKKWSSVLRFTVSNTLIIVNEERAENNTFDAISLCGGSYFSYPLSSRWLIGSKLLGGYVHYPQLELTDRSVSSRSGFCMGSGVSLTFKAKEYYGIRFFLDYNLLPSHSRNSGEYMNMLTLGSSFMKSVIDIQFHSFYRSKFAIRSLTMKR